VLRRHTLNQRLCSQADNVPDLAAHERLKHDELVNAVDKLGPAGRQQGCKRRENKAML
jgi:hypothetical protein